MFYHATLFSMRSSKRTLNFENDLTDLYRSLNVNGEQEECNLEAIMKINSYLNSSLDLRNVISDQPPQQQSNSNTSIDAYLNELVNGTDRVDAGPTTVQKTSVSSTGPCNIEGTAARSRFLSPSFSYSSDSSASPHSPFNPHSVPQVYSRNDVFNCYDESSHSSGSSNFYSPSMPQRMRISAASDPGSPTLEDAILMGCQNDNVFGTDINANKINDIMLADLVSSLSLGSGNGHSNTYSPLNNLPSCGISRNSGITNHLVGSVDSQQLPGSSMLGLQHPSSLCNINNQLYGMNSFHKQQQRAVAPFSSGIDTNSAALQNALLASQICPNLIDRGSFLTGGNDRSPNMANFQTGDAYFIEKAAKMHRNAAAVCDAACTWSGQLPPRIHKNPIYSCKVFLGGVPWDVTECVLKQTFIQFGNIRVEWPGKEFSANLRKGYVYILFEHEKQVKSLLASCCQDFSMSGNYYFKVSSRRMRQKDVQIIPWVISDSNYVRCPSYLLDPAKTVFVGALHGMLSAESLANIMNDLFGGVVFAGIDTDKHKYPIGSGRVTFNNVQSYRKAVRAAFIEIKTQKFTKKVQVDPYLADSMCQLCVVQQGPFFCRDENCFKYFCRSCWQMTHPQDSHGHKPLMRNPKLCTQTTLNRVI